MSDTTKNACQQAIDDFRAQRQFRSDWLLALWALAGGAVGSSLILVSNVFARIFDL